MKILERMKIVQKIPALAIVSALVVGLAVGTVSVIVGANVIATAETEKLDAAAEGRKHELAEYLHEIQADLDLTAKHPFTIDALNAFSVAYAELGDGASQTLRAAYIENNPNPLGEKHLLDAAKGDNSYNEAHATYHPLFRDQLNARGYYDIFLFNAQGDLIYTVFKELDYATNFRRDGGKWADTDLGNAFRAGIALNKGESQFFDFKPYAPSNDVPAAFMSQPIFEGDQRIGVLAFQMQIDRINAVMDGKAGLGQTGETLLVGEDRLLRNDSSHTEQSDILNTRYDSAALSKVFEGVIAHGEETGYRDMQSLFAAMPLSFGGVDFAVVALQGKDEALGAIGFLTWTMAGIGLLVAAIVAFGAWAFSRTITGPMANISSTMARISQNELDLVVQNTGRADEVGDMARAVEIFRDNAEKIAALDAEERERAAKLAARNEAMQALQDSMGEVVGAAAAGDFSHRIELNCKMTDCARSPIA